MKKNKKEENLFFGRPGKVLHIDGDQKYLENCLNLYKKLGIFSVGKIIKEENQPKEILELVKEVKPNVVVITGHDAMQKDIKDYRDLKFYKNSKYYVESVKILRDYEPNYDNLIIFAGACQSCYEELLDAGANFASSPKRILIHCLDPVFICEKICFTGVSKVIDIKKMIENTITGIEGVGGIESKGTLRQGYPKSKYF